MSSLAVTFASFLFWLPQTSASISPTNITTAAGEKQDPESRLACKQILAAAAAVPPDGRAYKAYRECQEVRPPRGLLSAAAEPDDDCADFVRMYQTATHYGGEPHIQEFCAMVATLRASEPVTDPKIAKHRTCVADVASILESDGVQAAVRSQCLKLHPFPDDIDNLTKHESCVHYSELVAISVGTGVVDAPRICDFALTSPNGTHGFDFNHFVYSCVQYAHNLEARAKAGESSRELGREARRSCAGSLRDENVNASGFCRDYARMVREDKHRHAEALCESQYQRMHRNVSSEYNDTAAALAEAEDAAVDEELSEDASEPSEEGAATASVHRDQDVAAKDLPNPEEAPPATPQAPAPGPVGFPSDLDGLSGSLPRVEEPPAAAPQGDVHAQEPGAGKPAGPAGEPAAATSQNPSTASVSPAATTSGTMELPRRVAGGGGTIRFQLSRRAPQSPPAPWPPSTAGSRALSHKKYGEYGKYIEGFLKPRGSLLRVPSRAADTEGDLVPRESTGAGDDAEAWMALLGSAPSEASGMGALA